MATVGNHQQGAFSSPTNGTSADASVVLANDNAVRSTANAHDADATIHVQSSVLAARPAAGTAQRVWVTTDGLRAYVDSGSVWNELDYLSKTAGGTVTGAVTLSAALTAVAASFSGAVTIASNAVYLSGYTVAAASKRIIGINASDKVVIDADGLGAIVAGALTANGGLTVSAGTTAVQALTATTGGFTGSITSSAAAPFVATNPAPTSLHQVLSSAGSTTGAVSVSFANTGNSMLMGIENSSGGFLFTGTSAYSAVFGTASARSVHLVTNNSVRLTIDSAGAVSGISSLTATTLVGTLSTAAQPNITSVGVLASPHMTSPVVDSGGVTVTAGGLTVTGNSVVTGTLKATAQGLFGPNSGAGTLGFLAVSSDTVGTASAGAASLPAAPVGFLAWYNGSTVIKIPYYA